MSRASLVVVAVLVVIYWSEKAQPAAQHKAGVGGRTRGRRIYSGEVWSVLWSALGRDRSSRSIMLGTTAVGRRYLPSSDSLLVFGPTRSGKTLTLALPLLNEFRGTAVVTSVKRDLYQRSIAARQARGECALFDLSDPASSSWNLFSLIADLRSAKEISDSLCGVTRGTTSEIEFWSRLASKMCAPLLLAARELGASLGEMIGWIERQELEVAFEGLVQAEHLEARSALEAVVHLDQRAVSSVVATLLSLLEPYGDPVVSDLLSREGIDLERLFAKGRSDTLYICSPLFRAERFFGVYEVFLRKVFDTAYQSDNGDRKVLFLLDEIANIAPISDLGKIASTCGGYGLVLVSIFQDLTQLSTLYGGHAGTVVNNHRSKLLLSGISDQATLDYVERACSRRAQDRDSVNPLLDLKMGTGLLMQANSRPVRLRLRPFPR